MIASLRFPTRAGTFLRSFRCFLEKGQKLLLTLGFQKRVLMTWKNKRPAGGNWNSAAKTRVRSTLIIRVDTRGRMLDLVDANRVIASFPITPGSKACRKG